MLVSDFSANSSLYEGFEIWEIDGMPSFFKGNQILSAIFKDFYGFSFDEWDMKRELIVDSNFEIMTNMLRLVEDKTFMIFTLHDENHLELVGMQNMKTMNFGLDIEKIKPDCVYVMIMDRKRFN
ncbi:hypothetical protein BH09BAC5_BH09BAC5_14690 [soil metagenome]